MATHTQPNHSLLMKIILGFVGKVISVCPKILKNNDYSIRRLHSFCIDVTIQPHQGVIIVFKLLGHTGIQRLAHQIVGCAYWAFTFDLVRDVSYNMLMC